MDYYMREEWHCCQEIFLNLEDIHKHINLKHLPTMVNSSKHLCKSCFQCHKSVEESKFHFLMSHIFYQVRCLKCRAGYQYFGTFIEHVEICNYYEKKERDRIIFQNNLFKRYGYNK